MKQAGFSKFGIHLFVFESTNVGYQPLATCLCNLCIFRIKKPEIVLT